VRRRRGLRAIVALTTARDDSRAAAARLHDALRLRRGQAGGLIFAIVRPEGRAARSLRWLDGNNCVRVGSMLAALSLFAVLLGNHSHPGA
jgi:hypothetical protein